MPMLPASLPPHRRYRRSRCGGFTILEVGLAAAVMAFAVATSLLAMQYGLRSVDTARNLTLAAQIMQSDMEILRLQNWSQISALAASSTVDPATTITSGTGTSLDSTLTTIANRFTCTRTVADIAGRADIKAIGLSIRWTGIDGRSHTVSYQMRYAKNGLSDYFYVAH